MLQVLPMGNQRARSPRNLDHGHGMQRREKTKTNEQKQRSKGSFAPQENVPASEMIVNRTLNALHNLGTQRFALSPFSEHLNRWLTNLKDVLSEFQSHPTVTADEQFTKEQAQILSNIELDFEKTRFKEAHSNEAIKNLSDSKTLLVQVEQDYAATTKEIEQRKDIEIKRLSSNVNDINEELDHIARMKAGLFRRISKNTKAQKEIETKQRLNAAQNELASTMQQFTAQQEKQRDEYEKRRQTLIQQIRNQEQELESQDIDDSVEIRRATCDALINSVNSLLQRKGVPH